MDHKSSNMLSWALNDSGVAVGVEVETGVGVTLGGSGEGVYVAVGSGVEVGNGVVLDLARILPARCGVVGLWLIDGLNNWQARRLSTIDSNARGRSLEFIYTG